MQLSSLIRGMLFVGAIALLLAEVDPKSLSLPRVDQLDLRFVLPMLATSLGILFVFALRWSVISNALGIRLGFFDFLRALWLSQAMGEIGPPLLVGEATRFAVMSSKVSPGALILSQGIDRFSGLPPLVLIALIELPFLPGFGDISWRWVVEGLFLGVLILGGIFWASPGFHNEDSRLKGFRFDLLTIPRGTRHYGLSFLVQSGLMLNWVFAAHLVGVGKHGFQVAMGAPWILLLTTLVPGFFSDWGKREALSVYVLGMAGISSADALWTSLFFGMSHSLVALPGLGFLLARKGAKPTLN